MTIRPRHPILKLAFLAAVMGASATGAGPAQAAITLGSDLATEPGTATDCTSGTNPRACLFIGDVLPGRALVAPATGTIVRWNLRVGSSTEAQTVRIRVVRLVGSDAYAMVSSGGLQSIPAGAGLYQNLPAQLPISPGDQLGIDGEAGMTLQAQATSPGAHSFVYNPSPADGGTTTPPVFDNPNLEVSFNAVLEPSNSFTLGAVSRNKKKGTATVDVTVPNAGEVTGSGKGAKVARNSVARASATAAGPGTVKLTIKAKGKKKRTLNETGKVKTKVKITYTPTGGDPSTQSLGLKLKKLK